MTTMPHINKDDDNDGAQTKVMGQVCFIFFYALLNKYLELDYCNKDGNNNNKGEDNDNGAQDASASRAPCMFYFLIYLTK